MNGSHARINSTLPPIPATTHAAGQGARHSRSPGLWRRFWSHPLSTQYHRLFALVTLTNLAVLTMGVWRWGWWSSPLDVPLQTLGDLMLGNLALAVIIRQQRLINVLFWIATHAPKATPLWLRWQLAKVFHFGGLHSAGASCGTLWFAVLLGAQVWHVSSGGTRVSTRTLEIGAALLVLLVAIVLMALPRFRSTQHNRFELMHRFGGWSALLLFWAHACSTVTDALPPGATGAAALVRAPAVWVLCVLTLCVAAPWFRLRRVPVEVVKPSPHAVILRFKHGKKPFPGSAVAISLSPLMEWHSFATVASPHEDGFRLIVSRAGDWTGALIDKPPTHMWVKGITTAGVANVESAFKRVLYVATGSGIGPVMPHLLYQRLPLHLIWATRNPVKTYGQALVDEIRAVMPNAEIWDTDVRGKPDLSAMAIEGVARFNAEAVIVIANRKLTEQVIRAVELQGIPGYGAIWDS